MIRAFFFEHEEQLFYATTKQLNNHYNSTRFIKTPPMPDYPSIFDYLPSFRMLKYFTLALSGGDNINKLLEYWLYSQDKKDFIKSTDYYWLNECCVPYEDENSIYGNAHRAFFQYAHILPQKVHPIHGKARPEQETQRYASQLPLSIGVQYQPTCHFIDSSKTLVNFRSPFHCAIMELDSDYFIPNISVNSPLIFSDTQYYVIKDPRTQLSHIMASMELLRNTPRLIVLAIQPESTRIIEDLYYGNNAHHPMVELLLHHPNVHIFTTNKKMEGVIYPEREGIGYYFPGDVLKVAHGPLGDLIKF